MNQKLTSTTAIEGSPNEKLFTIAKFHETRLGRIEKYLGTVEKKLEKGSEENTRMNTLEENLNVAFDSLQNLTHRVGTDLEKLGELEKKMNKMAGKGSNTTKLAVMGEQLRLLAAKVEDLESAQQNNEESEGEEEEEEGSA
ncbi:hypothetical protein [uncultured Mediterranean phage]|nr:hypothetical protein [uncultured Mediterranean phage]